VPWLEVLGWAGSAVLVVSLAQASVLRFRALNLVASLALAVYNLALGVWPMVALNAVLVGINGLFLVRLLRTRDDARTYEVVEVPADDGYLRHLLARQAADVERHNPGFSSAPPQPGRLAFLVVRGTEAVGVVLLAPRADGTAVVELDYVLPRFRDFSVGRFVYRHVLADGGPLAARGVRRVVASPRMTDGADYFPRVGVERAGDDLVLER